MLEKIKINKIIEIAREAGSKIMGIYSQDFEVETKDDNSPLTQADRASNEVILAGLKEAYPEIPFISEETRATEFSERKSWDLFWLIDPLDGTKEFIKKNGEFTVNIALVKNGKPVLGVVYVPARKTTYYALSGEGSFKIDESGTKTALESATHYSEKDSIIVIASRSHLSDEVRQFVDDLKAKGKEVEFLSAGSSLKLCLVAEGKADVYPRFGPTMEWDTGAAHAVAELAGRKVLNAETMQPLQYNKESLLNPWFIVE